MIDKTIKNIKKYFKTLKKNTYSKNINNNKKKKLYKVLEGVLTAEIAV